jgi:hypothetical protein
MATMDNKKDFSKNSIETIEDKIMELLEYIGKGTCAVNNEHESKAVMNLISARASLRAELMMYGEEK